MCVCVFLLKIDANYLRKLNIFIRLKRVHDVRGNHDRRRLMSFVILHLYSADTKSSHPKYSIRCCYVISISMSRK